MHGGLAPCQGVPVCCVPAAVNWPPSEQLVQLAMSSLVLGGRPFRKNDKTQIRWVHFMIAVIT